MPTYSDAYIQHLTAGPFPNQPDPWAEVGRFFHQLHGEMISALLGQIRAPLLAMGYVAGRETSLQIAENRQPDVFIQRDDEQPAREQTWNYPAAAKEALADPGVILEGQPPELDALVIQAGATGELVTIIEIVSPRNKHDDAQIGDYRARRERLLQRGVNVVEFDLTRSVKRLTVDALVDTYPYHVALHLYDQSPRLVGVAFGEPLKRVALPLRAEVVPADLEDAYRLAYRQTSLAWHIHTETQYAENALPFPSLLTTAQRDTLLKRARTWQEKLSELR